VGEGGGRTTEVLAAAAAAEESALAEEFELHDVGVAVLDDRVAGLVRVAALIALDAPPATYGRQVSTALAAGATPEDVLGVLRAVSAQVGGAKVVAAAPEIMLALGLALPEYG
jgi:alkylhydroperoxidase/carboxymuconolactone decarboxylase family protein YurZ